MKQDPLSWDVRVCYHFLRVAVNPSYLHSAFSFQIFFHTVSLVTCHHNPVR